MANKLSRKNWIRYLCHCRKWYLFRYVFSLLIPPFPKSLQNVAKSCHENSNSYQINVVFVPLLPYSRTHTSLMLSYLIQMENKLVWKHFSFGKFVLRIARYPIRVYFLFSVSNNMYKRSHWSVTKQMWFRNSIWWAHINGPHVFAIELYKVSFTSSHTLWYRCSWCQRMVIVNGKLREVAERNHQRITSLFLVVHFNAVTFRMAYCFSWETFVLPKVTN